MPHIKMLLVSVLIFCSHAYAQRNMLQIDEIHAKIYPEVNNRNPELPSPFKTRNGQEYVIAVTKENKFAIAPVTLTNDLGVGGQLVVDSVDFPTLAKTGLHSEPKLNKAKFITGRPIEEITRLGRPNGLSQAGFMAENETILSVIKSDNRTVFKLGLTHPQLAKPLFHILNLMETDLALNRWNLAKHRWENIQYIYYNGFKVFLDVEDTKGGQKSIFNDEIEGAFYIKIRRELSPKEQSMLEKKYADLSMPEFEKFKTLLSSINTSEMEPQYIMRYGFYEGHTFWRTDPIALAFIFGLRTLTEIEEKFEGNLPQALTKHFID